jgi:hypothetical protein
MRHDFHRGVELQSWALEHALSPMAAPPDDWPLTFRLPGSHLAPLKQGDYAVAHSAAFAAVNAFRLVSVEQQRLSRADEYALLSAAWRWQEDRGETHFMRGLRGSDWPRLVECLHETLSRRQHLHINVSQPWRQRQPVISEFLSAIERFLVARHVVVGLFMGAHYSVIRGFTPASLLLFDSGGQCSVRRRCLGLVGEAHRLRHHLVASSTLTLRRTS